MSFDIISILVSCSIDDMKTNRSILKFSILAPLLCSVFLGSFVWSINEVSHSGPRPIDEIEVEIEEAVIVRKKKAYRKKVVFLLFLNRPVSSEFFLKPAAVAPAGHRLTCCLLAPLII